MARKTISDALLLGALPPLLAGYARLVARTTRWEREGEAHFRGLIASGAPFIVAFWHARLLMLFTTVPEMGRPGVAMVSAHRDGEAIARTLERLGVGAVRGSAQDPRKPDKAKGGAGALKQLVSLARSGANTAITPDGPRGPAGRAQPGVAQLARLAGAVVQPVAYAVRPGRYLSSWDRFLLPAPFGRGVFVFGEPVRVEGRGAAALEEGRLRIEAELNRITALADERVGHEASRPERERSGAADAPLPGEAAA